MRTGIAVILTVLMVLGPGLTVCAGGKSSAKADLRGGPADLGSVKFKATKRATVEFDVAFGNAPPSLNWYATCFVRTEEGDTAPETVFFSTDAKGRGTVSVEVTVPETLADSVDAWVYVEGELLSVIFDTVKVELVLK